MHKSDFWSSSMQKHLPILESKGSISILTTHPNVTPCLVFYKHVIMVRYDDRLCKKMTTGHTSSGMLERLLKQASEVDAKGKW